MNAAASSTAIALFLVATAACQKKNDCSSHGVLVEIAGNHGHETVISPEQVERGAGRMYPLRGGTHEHAMSLTDADMQGLEAGRPVTTRSTTVQGHVHEIGVSCKKN
jgi:hypothetical protein